MEYNKLLELYILFVHTKIHGKNSKWWEKPINGEQKLLQKTIETDSQIECQA